MSLAGKSDEEQDAVVNNVEEVAERLEKSVSEMRQFVKDYREQRKARQTLPGGPSVGTA
jgi:signal transduction histidine kinase